MLWRFDRKLQRECATLRDPWGDSTERRCCESVSEGRLDIAGTCLSRTAHLSIELQNRPPGKSPQRIVRTGFLVVKARQLFLRQAVRDSWLQFAANIMIQDQPPRLYIVLQAANPERDASVPRAIDEGCTADGRLFRVSPWQKAL
ncbi:hypothetical protein F1559_002356 [Cyanidiococcus yangmingshanensis]|uniref:Uncharacterized protein n=1 Tax=Cyanidiococcus yangmingshanensis TaxID=2690220 RepID=A0A7J7IE25_9RHOD|nr:hypothetical protein F1559_002356 [Cyanidiococcus yangmingshanensis]